MLLSAISADPSRDKTEVTSATPADRTTHISTRTMFSPLLEKDLNTLDVEPLTSAEHLAKAPSQAANMKRSSQSLHKLHKGDCANLPQPSSAWPKELTSSRDYSKKVCHRVQEANSHSSNPAPPPAGPLTALSLNIGVEDMLMHIRRSKLTEGRPLKPILPSQPQPCQDVTDGVRLIGEDSGRIKWIQPSGPRRSGEGTEDEEQGIVSAETTASGGAVAQITLLAAGFIIGPSGSSVREVSKQTGADIKSWTEKAASAPGRPSRPVRSFVIEGKRRAVVLALDIICDAVDRYKELCEGGYCGQFVARIQKVRGVEFSYQPPPRNIVPYAAALKGQHPRLPRQEAAAPGAPMKRLPPHFQPRPVSTESMSSTGSDGNSDMDEDAPPAAAHKASSQRIHSKADVMQSYLEPSAKSTPNIHHRNSDNSNPNRKLLFTPPGLTSNQSYDKQYQSDFCSARPHFAADKAEPINSWLEHCKQGSRQVQSSSVPEQFCIKAVSYHGSCASAPAATAPPAGMVEVRPNVWLPRLALQQAQGDFALAVQIAAHSSNPQAAQFANTSSNSWNAEPAFAQFNRNPPQPDSPLVEHYNNLFLHTEAEPHQDNSMKHSKKPLISTSSDFEQHNSRGQFVKANMASYSTPRSNTLSPTSPAGVKGIFDTAAEQQGMYSKYLPDSQEQYNLNTAAGTVASGFNFKSPDVGMPFIDPSNSFISPQCVLDNNSLFSYNLAGEHTAKPSSAGWYAKSSPLFYQAPMAPEHNSNVHSSKTYSDLAPTEAFTGYTNQWQSGTAPFSAGQGTEAGAIGPNKQSHKQISSEVYSGSTNVSAWPGYAEQLAKNDYHQSIKLQPFNSPAANAPAGFWSPLKMPWVQGSHPLLKGKGHS